SQAASALRRVLVRWQQWPIGVGLNHAGVSRGSNAFDTVRVNQNATLLVEPADSLFEVALADPEQLRDFLGGGLVADRQTALVFLQLLHDQGLQAVDGFAAQRLQTQADLAVGTQLADVALLAHTAAQKLEGLVFVNQPPMLAIDNRLVAQIGAFHHQQIDRLAYLITRRGLVQVAVQPRRGGNAPGVLVEVDVDDAVVSFLQWALFLGVRQQKILGQTPVEEQPDAVDLHHLQAGKLTNLNLGLFGGGDQLVIAVEVHEDVEPVVYLGRRILGDVTIGQQDFAIRAAVQIKTEVGVFDDLQAVVAPDCGHGEKYPVSRGGRF